MVAIAKILVSSLIEFPLPTSSDESSNLKLVARILIWASSCMLVLRSTLMYVDYLQSKGLEQRHDSCLQIPLPHVHGQSLKSEMI